MWVLNIVVFVCGGAGGTGPLCLTGHACFYEG